MHRQPRLLTRAVPLLRPHAWLPVHGGTSCRCRLLTRAVLKSAVRCNAATCRVFHLPQDVSVSPITPLGPCPGEHASLFSSRRPWAWPTLRRQSPIGTGRSLSSSCCT